MLDTPPSSAVMRVNLAHDAQTNRYSREILLEIMRCIARVTQAEEDNAPIFATMQPAPERFTPEQIPLLSHT